MKREPDEFAIKAIVYGMAAFLIVGVALCLGG